MSRNVPLRPGIGTRALGSQPAVIALGCAPCKAMQKQKEANEEFARRYGVVRDTRVPMPVVIDPGTILDRGGWGPEEGK